MAHFERITIDPEVMSGKPCIRAMRVTVGMIVEPHRQRYLLGRSAERADRGNAS